MAEISAEYLEIIETLEEDEKQASYLNDSNDAFVSKELKLAVDEILQDIENDEIIALKKYLELSKKKDKLDYIQICDKVNWSVIDKGADGTCKKAAVNNRIQEIKRDFNFVESSIDFKLVSALKLMDEESAIKKEVKQKKDALHIKTKEVIENLTEEEALQILEHKWIKPLLLDLVAIADSILLGMNEELEYISQKYKTTMHDIQDEKSQIKECLSDMVGLLNATGSDFEGLQEFKKILGGQV